MRAPLVAALLRVTHDIAGQKSAIRPSLPVMPLCPRPVRQQLTSGLHLADEKGRDRDVTTDVRSFMSYSKIDGIDLEIQFATKFAQKDGKWAMDLTKRNMKQLYDDSGYSWCDADKKEELIDHGGAARFLIVRKKRTERDDSHSPVAFAHFRFTLQGEAVGVEGGQVGSLVLLSSLLACEAVPEYEEYAHICATANSLRSTSWICKWNLKFSARGSGAI